MEGIYFIQTFLLVLLAVNPDTKYMLKAPEKPLETITRLFNRLFPNFVFDHLRQASEMSYRFLQKYFQTMLSVISSEFQILKKLH